MMNMQPDVNLSWHVCIQNKLLTTWQGPRQGHEEVTEVVGMPDETPPAGHQQPLPC